MRVTFPIPDAANAAMVRRISGAEAEAEAARRIIRIATVVAATHLSPSPDHAALTTPDNVRVCNYHNQPSLIALRF